jgi:hypothetical protein
MKKIIPASIYQKIGQILIIFTKAVRKAQEENRKLGLPNVCCERGEIFYQLPDGRITREIPKSLSQNL